MGFLVVRRDQFFHWDIAEINITHIHLYSINLFLLIIFFSLFILLTIMFFYRHHQRFSTSTAAATAVSPPPQRSFGLHPSNINSLLVTLHLSWVKSIHNKDTRPNMQTEWSIFLGVFEDEDKLKVLLECKLFGQVAQLPFKLPSLQSFTRVMISLDEIVNPPNTTTAD